MSRWAERYDRKVEDLFDVLDEITEMIAATVEPEVGYAERDRVRRRPPADLRTWDLFHMGIAHFFRFTADDNLEAQRLLARCRELDPGFADAHAWWAYATVLGMVYWETQPDAEALDAALAATQRALEMDDHNAVFHMLRGRVQLARREYAARLPRTGGRSNSTRRSPPPTAGWGTRCATRVATTRRSPSSSVPSRWAPTIRSAGRSCPTARWRCCSPGRFEEAIEWADEAAVVAELPVLDHRSQARGSDPARSSRRGRRRVAHAAAGSAPSSRVEYARREALLPQARGAARSISRRAWPTPAFPPADPGGVVPHTIPTSPPRLRRLRRA